MDKPSFVQSPEDIDKLPIPESMREKLRAAWFPKGKDDGKSGVIAAEPVSDAVATKPPVHPVDLIVPGNNYPWGIPTVGDPARNGVPAYEPKESGKAVAVGEKPPEPAKPADGTLMTGSPENAKTAANKLGKFMGYEATAPADEKAYKDRPTFYPSGGTLLDRVSERPLNPSEMNPGVSAPFSFGYGMAKKAYKAEGKTVDEHALDYMRSKSGVKPASAEAPEPDVQVGPAEKEINWKERLAAAGTVGDVYKLLATKKITPQEAKARIKQLEAGGDVVMGERPEVAPGVPFYTPEELEKIQRVEAISKRSPLLQKFHPYTDQMEKMSALGEYGGGYDQSEVLFPNAPDFFPQAQWIEPGQKGFTTPGPMAPMPSADTMKAALAKKNKKPKPEMI